MNEHRLGPPDEHRLLRGLDALMGHLTRTYAREGGTPSGTLILLLLDQVDQIIGSGRVRGSSPTASPFELTEALTAVLRPLSADARAADGAKVIAVRYRGQAGVPAGQLESDTWLWSALCSACGAIALEPVDAITVAGGLPHSHQDVLRR